MRRIRRRCSLSRGFDQPFVMAGLVPAIHVSSQRKERKTWMPAPSAGMTCGDISTADECRDR
jgi:hypothetical protein